MAYKFHTQVGASTSALVPPAYTFARQMTCDNDEDNWDFTGRPSNWMINTSTDDGSDPDVTNPQSFEEVVSGVERFDIIYYNESDAQVTPDARGNLEIPYRVEVNIVLFDETMVDAPAEVRFQTRRSFTKILYLGDLKTN